MPSESNRFPRRLLLLGWDAADWKVIDPLLKKGEMPHLARMIANGVHGDITTLQPILSPMLWNSIATGQRADRHGVLGFTEVCPTTGTVRPVSGVSRTARALWNMVNVRGGRSHVVNWFCSHPAEPINGLFVSDSCAHALPMPGQAPALPENTFHIPPDLLGKATGLTQEEMAQMQVRPDEIDPAILQLFVPRANEIDQKKDHHLVSLAKLIAESFTVHNYSMLALSAEPWDLAAFYYPSIDHFSHGFMTFHGDRLPWIAEEQHALYNDVVNGAYRLHDLLLGRILQVVGENTNVILTSDHGFHSDHLRPQHIPKTPTGPEVQHRELGIVALSGPDIRKGERLYGASLLDIAPTALTLLGLPVGADMPGRVLIEAFPEMPAVTTIPSWDDEPGEDGRYRGEYVLPQGSANALMEQFIGLGYIDPIDNDKTRAAEKVRREGRWNLARTHVHAGRFDLAAPILQKLHAADPERVDFSIALAEALCRIGLAAEAGELLSLLAQMDRGNGANTSYLLAVAALETGHLQQALDHLLEAEAKSPGGATFHVRVGFTYLRLRRIEDADKSFARALEIDPHEPAAHLGRAGCAMRSGKPEDAALLALRAIGLRREMPLAHVVLGRALLAIGRTEEATRCLEIAVRLNPNAVRARRMLLRLYSVRTETALMASQQKIALQQMREQRLQRVEARRTWHDELRIKLRENIAQQQELLKKLSEKREPGDIVIVSGLPRSGTSLMMQMLQAGGIEILADGERAADVDNPEGYLEWEAVKKLGSQPDLIREADGKAVKVISMLLPLLPAGHKYKVIFMDRAPAEIAASQAKMLKRRGAPAEATENNPLGNPKLLRQHRNYAVATLEKRKNVDLLVVPYAELVADPAAWSTRVAEFLGPEKVAHPDRLVEAVRPDLYRNRAKGHPESPATEVAG